MSAHILQRAAIDELKFWWIFQEGIIVGRPIFLILNKLKVLTAYWIFCAIYLRGKLSAFKRCAKFSRFLYLSGSE